MKKGWKKLAFTVQEDMKIIENALTRQFRWSELAKKMNRSYDMVYDRWKVNLNSKITKESLEKTIPFEKAAQLYLLHLKDLDRQGIEHATYKSTIWTPEMDQKLLRLVSKIGPSFSLLHSDFPGCSSREVRKRYMQFFQTHFNPKEDEKLLLISDSKSSLWNLHFEHFPNHSPYAISERIDFLKKYGPLTQYVESISKSVALKGRRFFYEREAQFAGRGKYALLDEWAFYEPIDQQRAIWPKHIDVELVRSKLRKRESPFLLNLRAQELRNRFYHLSTTDIPQLKERFELGKN